MEYQFVNLTETDVSGFRTLIEKISEEDFPQLNQKYNEMKVVFYNNVTKLNGIVEKEVSDFIGGTPVSLRKDSSGLRTTSAPPKAFLSVELKTFEAFPIWKKSLSLRHEFAHMLNKENPKTLSTLLAKYGVSKIGDFVRFENEFGVHLLMIQKWQDDWLKEPIGFKDSMPNPANTALAIRKTKGKKEAMLFCIKYIVHLSTFLKLYDKIADEKKGQVRAKKLRAKKYLQSFAGALRVDSKSFPEPYRWFDDDDFLTQEAYYQKIEKLLDLLEKA